MNLSNYLSKTKNGLEQHRSIAPLPEVEKTPILLMRFTSNATSEVIQTVIDSLTQGGIIIIKSEGICSVSGNNNLSKDSSAFIIGLTTTQKLLEHEAEIIRLVKPCRTRHKHIPTIMERFTSAARADFISYERQESPR